MSWHCSWRQWRCQMTGCRLSGCSTLLGRRPPMPDCRTLTRVHGTRRSPWEITTLAERSIVVTRWHVVPEHVSGSWAADLSLSAQAYFCDGRPLHTTLPLKHLISGMSAHRTAPAHLIFCPLRSFSAPLRLRFAHMLCLVLIPVY